MTSVLKILFKSAIYPYMFPLLCSMERLHKKKVKPYAPWNKVFVSEVKFLCWKKTSKNGN